MTSTDMRAPAVNERGLALIKRFEGFRAVAYRDPGGVFTIGYGHTSAAGDPAIHPGLTITGEEGERVLARDVAHFAAKVAGLVRVPLNGDQFSALVSFAYNVGIENFRTSSVLKAVNARDFEAVPRRLALWVKAGGRVLPGLVARRAAEGELFAKDGLEPSDTDRVRPMKAFPANRHGRAPPTGQPPSVRFRPSRRITAGATSPGPGNHRPCRSHVDRQGAPHEIEGGRRVMALPVTLIITLVRELLAGPAQQIIDRYVTNIELREKLKSELQGTMIAEAETRLSAQRDIIMREIEAGSWLARSWRPIFMIMLMSFVAIYGLLLPIADLIAGAPLAFRPRWRELPPEFWDMLTVGLGGYIGGRSLEKIATSIAGRSRKSQK